MAFHIFHTVPYGVHSLKIHPAQHQALPWRIKEIVPDFELIDAWALPVSGRPSEFRALEEVFKGLDPNARGAPKLPAMLFALRARLGTWFGWEDEANALRIPGSREMTLRERLPEDLRDEGSIPAGSDRFQLVYRTKTEWARERSNDTVHAVLHIGWVPAENDLYRAQLGVYVKTRGWFGPIYMAIIRPFRHFIVYPAMLREIGKAWEARSREPITTGACDHHVVP